MKMDGNVNIIDDVFSEVMADNGFKKSNEIEDGQLSLIEYRSEVLIVRIKNYFREFDVTLYKIGYEQDGINLFNLLDFIKDPNDTSRSKYFEEVKDLKERYRKQLSYLAVVFVNNIKVINDFFEDQKFELKTMDLRNFMIKKYPNLFKT
jgi:hypothetical protein